MSDLTQPPAEALSAGVENGDVVAARLRLEVLDLLAAIRDALDVPLPGLDEADRAEYQAVTRRRLSEVHTVLHVALDPEWVGTTDPAREAAVIRQRTAASPVTYAVWQRPADAPADLEAGQEALRLRDGRLAEQRHQVLDPAVPVPAVVVGG